LIKVPYISLVNLILDKPAVKELIQNELTPENLRVELEKLINDPVCRSRLMDDYERLWEILAQGGSASAKAAGAVVEAASQK
jgi:lipid-A-disaccharide synthase